VDTTPWASVRDVEYHTSDDVFEYFRCAGCRAVFLAPAPLDRLHEIYPANYYSYSGGKRSTAQRVKDALDARLFRRLLGALPGEELSAVDIGGGDGSLLTHLRRLEPRITHTQVVDLDESAAQLARANGHAYHCGPVESFAPDRSYDLVVLLNLIEHVADPRAVLASVRSMLAPGGTAILKTPNVDSLDARLFRHRDWGGYHCPRHWVLFDRDNLTDLATDVGLTVRRATYTQGAPFWTVSVLAALQRRGLARVDAERPAVQHPLFGPLNAAFAAFDLGRSALGARPSQLFVELSR
jgi:SAM-dependent methyltransferase